MSEFLAAESQIAEQSPQTLEELCALIRSHSPRTDLSLLEKAYHFSERAHTGQIRRSGEPYISHPLGVAGILADLRLDIPTIVTGLLHDTVEDTHATLEEIEREFGKVIAELVDGVTKISKMTFRNTHEKQGENIRKMIVAMGRDVRVILVKLADRLHNMRTLNHMTYEKQSRIAQETLDIYAPLAGRLGIMALKVELEDLSFRYSQPDGYYGLVEKVAKKKREREKYIEDTKRTLLSELAARTKARFEVYGRPKHLFSIWKKMQARMIDYDQVYDVLAFRVTVESISECYEVLGHVHSLWKPIPGRFKDFIAMPKANHYQSLHTTVIGPGGERIEIQIRTFEMHEIAERGIAAHWRYKEQGREVPGAEKFDWLKDLVTLHQQVRDSDEFLETVKSDLFESEIYVFTPRGDVRELPEGSTPIDFAYAVHTDVGNRCAAARVNGKLVPFRTKLRSGDQVEIVTRADQQPSKDWLKNCITPRAKSKIRQFVKAEERRKSIELGREILERELRKHGQSPQVLLKPAPDVLARFKDFGASDVDDLAALVGYGKFVVKEVVTTLLPELKGVPSEKDQREKSEASVLQKIFQSAAKKQKKSRSIIRVDGIDNMLVRFSKCCSPIPGDPIVGFITRGRGITIHRSDCDRAFEFDSDRRIDVEWTVDGQGQGTPERIVRVRVTSHDVPGLLKSMSEAFSVRGINIHNAQIKTTRDRKAICLFDVAVRDTSQLTQVMQDLKKIDGIIGVDRMVGA